jgi:hypothetical protein
MKPQPRSTRYQQPPPTKVVVVVAVRKANVVLPSGLTPTLPPKKTTTNLTIIEKYPLFRTRTALIVRYVEIYSDRLRANPPPRNNTAKENIALAQRTWHKITEQVNKTFPQLKAMSPHQAMTVYSIFVQAK